MKVNLSCLTFDLDGTVELNCTEESSIGSIERRLTRVATLDGGAVFNDFGFSEADRTAELYFLPTKIEQEEAVKRLVKLYARLRMTSREGIFEVAPQSYQKRNSESTLKLLIVRKLNE